ncbi:MAG TPA: patatin-like phospholipase family protein [Anaerolineaceae bacterium]|nr:patatin-like phospholipase family protein [Anaerolineaceae bacterium]
MSKCTAIVLGGGGSHGAFQVGALRAILEAGIVPDLLVGTSIGSINSVGLAMYGPTIDGLDRLEKTWIDGSQARLLDTRRTELTLRAMAGHPSNRSLKKVENYFISIGITPDLNFRMFPMPRLALVSADLKSGKTVIYGQNPDDPILEGIMMSIAVPPWFMPVQKDGQLIMDGGAFCMLPIEPALQMGATEIIALDLGDAPSTCEDNLNVPQYIDYYFYAVNRRLIYLETALAESQGVPVHRLDFCGLAPAPSWNYEHSQEMIRSGYEKARQRMDEWTRIARQDTAAEKADLAVNPALEREKRPFTLPNRLKGMLSRVKENI